MTPYFVRTTCSEYEKGQAALIASIFFMLISLAILGSVGVLGISHLERARELLYARQSLATAESGLDDAIYRIANAKAITDGETIYLNKASAVVAVPGISGGAYNVTARGNMKNMFRAVTARFTVNATNGIPFTAALGSGFLGITLEGNTTIKNLKADQVGSVFSNGSIDAKNGNADLITGNVVVARPIANDTPTSNLTSFGQRNADTEFENIVPPASPQESYVFHDMSSNSDIGQSFITPITAYVVQVKVYMRKTTAGAPPNLRAYIIPNNLTANIAGGKPYHPGSNCSSSTNYDYCISEKRILGTDPIWSTTNWQWVAFKFNVRRYAIENEKYWLVLEAEGADFSKKFEVAVSASSLSGNGYIYGQNNCYGQKLWCNSAPDGNGALGKGELKYSNDALVVNPNWTSVSPATDLAFKMYMGEGTTATIDDGPSIAYVTKSDSVDVCGDLKANTVIGASDVHGDVYYHNISGTVNANTQINNPDAPASCRSSDGPSPQACNEASSAPCRDYDGPNEPSPDPVRFQSELGEPWQKLVYRWRSVATTTIIGSQDITGTVTFGGSRYIDGYLHCHNNGKINFTGVLYVKEGGIFEDNCEVRVTGVDDQQNSLDGYIIFEGSGASPFNSGKVTVLNKAKFFKNTTGSNRTGYAYIYALYHNASGFNPLEPSQTIVLDSMANYGGGAFFAPRGEIIIRSNAETIALAASHIRASNSSKIKYEYGVATP